MARRLRLGTGIAIGLGAVMLVAGGLLVASAFQAGNQPLPYSYATTADKPSDAAAALAGNIDGAKARMIEMKTLETGKLLVAGEVLDLPDGKEILVGWQSKVGEPLIRSDISVKEEEALVAALKKHLPAKSTVFTMPALSRRLAAMTTAEYPLATADDSATTRLPAPWTGARAAILEAERKWRPEAEDETADKAFAGLLDALTAEDKYGIAHLQVMAGGAESYVILHVRDAFDIGVAAPEKLSVGLRDFPSAADVHGATKLVKGWIARKGYAAYAVIPRDENAVRAYYLATDRDKSSLLGQLLPFNSARLGLVPGATLVFQNGGYWVYRISAVRTG
jgi:hydroxylamine oxidation protein HaoB